MPPVWLPGSVPGDVLQHSKGPEQVRGDWGPSLPPQKQQRRSWDPPRVRPRAPGPLERRIGGVWEKHRTDLPNV